MAGETNLETLLNSMKPTLNDGEYVFCTREHISDMDVADCISLFREAEGVTLVMEKSKADAKGYSYSFIARWIILEVHSSLEAVGLTAAFSKALAHHGISCNVIAAYYHDHIFVGKEDADKAMNVLIQLSENGRSI